MIPWPKAPVEWIEGRTLCISIPFTWNLTAVLKRLKQREMRWDKALVGGPAAKLMPRYFDELPYVRTGQHHPDALYRVNPLATRTMIGCIRACKFCAVPKIEGRLREFDSWPNRPIVIDNNLLACSKEHFDRVIDGLKQIGEADFNQGLDARKLTDYHAQRIAEIRYPVVRLALDSMDCAEQWVDAFSMLRSAGIAKHRISSYAIFGFDSGIEEAWDRFSFIESFKIKAYPMWFHRLDAMKVNVVTDEQKALGWTDRERKKVMQWFYQHRDVDKPRRKAA